MDELVKRQVTFACCKKALEKVTVKPEELCSFAKVVPSGVVELAHKQSEGFFYIKP